MAQKMAQEYKAPPAELKELATGVYAYLGQGGFFCSNTGIIIGKKWATVFDSLTNKYMIEGFLSEVKKITDKPIRFLVNSHFDPDHTFTNHYFPEVIAIATVATRKETMKLHPQNLVILPKMAPHISFEGAKMTPQDMTYKEKLTIYDGEREIQIIDMGAAHTISDTVIYLPKEKIVFLGDIDGGARGNGLMSVDKGSYHMIEAMINLVNFDAEQFVPGHGSSVITKKQFVEMTTRIIEFLFLTREEARKLFNKGMTYQEAAEKLDYSTFAKWGNKDNLYGNVYGNFRRAWIEFKGELPLGGGMDLEETMGKKIRNPDGTYRVERIDLGYSRPWEDWK